MERCKGKIGLYLWVTDGLKHWKMNTTGLYPAPQDLKSTHSSLLAAHGTIKTSGYSYGLPEGQKKQPAEADQLSQDKSDTEI